MLRTLATAMVFAWTGLALAQSGTPAKAATKTWTAPRTLEGHPDLQGAWTTASVTPLQRPAELGTKESFTDEEARTFEQNRVRERDANRRDGGSWADINRAYNDEWYERGTKVVETKRTSLIVDPPDGRIPALTPQGNAQVERTRAHFAEHGFDGPEDRPLPDRCIQLSQVGPPMLPGNYNNNYQIVQSPDTLAIFAEMGGIVRVIPIDAAGARPHLPQRVTRWPGDSRGHWDGDTLVVETSNFDARGYTRFGLVYDGPSDGNLKVIERFRRTAPDTIMYRATVDDPTIYTKPWTLEIPMNKTGSLVYEYACHEGNLGMSGLLSGARAGERQIKGR